MPIKHMPNWCVTDSQPAFYDTDSGTAIEQTARTYAKMNEVIQNFNDLESETNKHLSDQDEKITEIREEKVPEDVKKECQRLIESGEFDAAINLYLNNLNGNVDNLRGRLDNLLGNVQNGSTTLDAEVIDLRVGADGNTYINAGESIRNNINKKINTELLFKEIPNLYPFKPLKIEHDGVTQYNGLGSDYFTLPSGTYQMLLTTTKPTEKILLQDSKSKRYLDLDFPEYGFYSFTLEEETSLYLYGYASLSTPSENEKGTYIITPYIFDEKNLPKISEVMIGKFLLSSAIEINCELIKQSPIFKSTYFGGLYIIVEWFKYHLEPSEYTFIIGENNYESVIIYDSVTFERLAYATGGYQGALNFNVREDNNDIVIGFNMSFDVESIVTDFYAKDLCLFKGKPSIPDWMLSGTQISKDISKIKTSIDVNEKTCVKKTDLLTTGTTIKMSEFPSFIKKNIALSFKGNIENFNSLLIGHGGNGVYGGEWFEITPTNIERKEFHTEENVLETISHGVNIEDFLFVALSYDNVGVGYLTIISKTGSFTHEFDSNFASSGALFVTTSQDMDNVIFNGTCEDFNKELWLVGDSYFGASNERVFGQLMNMGFKNFLIIGQAGLGSYNAWLDIEKALNYGTPKYIVWYMGMNDGATAEIYTQNMEKLKSICAEKGITLILNKVPTVPTIPKEEIAAVIEASGLRYIDSYGSVGATSSGWYDGMLSGDGVHPTEKGARVLAAQMLIDVPEIMSYGRKEN